MCIFPSSKKTELAKTIAAPEKTATPTDIGTARAAEDQALFGGVPDLRVDRAGAPPAVAKGGSGLKLM